MLVPWRVLYKLFFPQKVCKCACVINVNFNPLRLFLTSRPTPVGEVAATATKRNGLRVSQETGPGESLVLGENFYSLHFRALKSSIMSLARN